MDLIANAKLFIAQYHFLYKRGKVRYNLNQKTETFLREINMTAKAMSAYIYENLKPELYYQGPSKHHKLIDFQVMVFELPYENKKLYVKLAIGEEPISNNETDGIVIYMSFHPEEAEMNLPLQEGDNK
ncbi:hypothetical protein [Ligilactobacillus salivarius]|uniref:Uncharacterized protein n=1 Tax=Ligilactobacillus salivarius (strain UCC118) TaxID=362948 RepID=Q1WR48_LIGS1|nr:hypothetical protein [Ligilactobacillus salivarius]ABE00650.1 Hypothetical protein LSL_1844 [Ligilactobacillus salivarius UCC118]MDE1499295.1 hypothetical protein [Ligilactobacillus salivarius]MDE1523693.1 hypothetical protein [Ligilactobacillus salivarius]OQR18375.1 hypothetical protein B6U40_09850 [Ligilactobacillus salivarius]